MDARHSRAGELDNTAIGRTLTVSPAAVSQKHTQWQHGGQGWLMARPTGHPRSNLSAAQCRVVGRILDCGAEASGNLPLR